jgi:hypothetical protein
MVLFNVPRSSSSVLRAPSTKLHTTPSNQACTDLLHPPSIRPLFAFNQSSARKLILRLSFLRCAQGLHHVSGNWAAYCNYSHPHQPLLSLRVPLDAVLALDKNGCLNASSSGYCPSGDRSSLITKGGPGRQIRSSAAPAASIIVSKNWATYCIDLVPLDVILDKNGCTRTQRFLLFSPLRRPRSSLPPSSRSSCWTALQNNLQSGTMKYHTKTQQ